MRGKSTKRLEMGEKAWAEYQKLRQYRKAKKYGTAHRIRLKQRLIKYKGGECKKCGYDKDIPGAYAFHHRDPDEKEFSISRYTHVKWSVLQKEADKCDLICVRCHAEEHDKEFAEVRQQFLERSERHQSSRLKKIECARCGTEFKPRRRTSKYCSIKCSNQR